MTVALPVDAYSFESGVGKRRCEAGVAAADFDGACSFSFFSDIHSESDKLGFVLVVLDWFLCRDVRSGSFFVLSLSRCCPP